MWALPDITRLNAEAANAASKRDITRKLRRPALTTCEYCAERATHTEPWYDIFSDDAKGVLGLCDEHYENYGPTPEGYFTCGRCDRLMIDHYTWERYATMVDGEEVCLNCARAAYLADSDHWINFDQDDLNDLLFEDVRSAPHLIAVGQPCPSELRFIGNVEFDAMDGARLYGTRADGMRELRETLTKARETGAERAIFILDAAYQFAVSIGVYVDASAGSSITQERVA